MPKKGDVYEKLVAKVISAFDSSSVVQRGQWINGPDGRRDKDVSIQGKIDGFPFSILIECKDFSKKHHVGIHYVDALDSKRHDVGVNMAIICSNSGFTKPAISKAKRVDIGLISILKSGDNRIKTQIIEEIYTRKVKVETINVSFKEKTPCLPSLENITYKNVPIIKWVFKRIASVIMSNPTGNMKLVDSITFKNQTELKFGSKYFRVSGMDIRFGIETQWFSQIVIIDALMGIYDYLHGKVKLTPGDNQYIVKGVDAYGGQPINFVPEHDLFASGLQKGEIKINICLIEGLDMDNDPFPSDFNELINPEDLNLTLPSI